MCLFLWGVAMSIGTVQSQVKLQMLDLKWQKGKGHDPEALAEYEKAQVEKKAYENKLKNCKTRDESGEIKQEIEPDTESMEAEDLSFEKISRDIERYLRKNGEKKSSFVTNV